MFGVDPYDVIAGVKPSEGDQGSGEDNEGLDSNTAFSLRQVAKTVNSDLVFRDGTVLTMAVTLTAQIPLPVWESLLALLLI